MSSPKLVAEFLNDDEFPSHIHNVKQRNVHNKDVGDGRVPETDLLMRNLQLDLVGGKRMKARELWENMIRRSTQIGRRTDNTMPHIDKQSTTEERSIVKALASIRILNEDPSNQFWLRSYGGKLDSLPMHLLESIERCAPQSFHARVGDFNESKFQ